MSREFRFATHAHRERLLRGTLRSEHIVHFFDDEVARQSVVTAFVEDALASRRSVLLVARPALWTKIASRLRKTRTAASPRKRLVVLDANVILGAMMRHGELQPELFAENVAPLVKTLASTSQAGLSVYGEMVDILASEGNFTAANALEAAWNALSARVSMTLLCGYASAHFALAERETMSQVCAAHTRVETDASDALGRWLLDGDATIVPRAS